MTIWVVGDGIVGRRVRRLLGDHQALGFDPRRRHDNPAIAGDVMVLTHPVDHAELAADLGRRGVSVVTVGDGLDDTCELLELDNDFRASNATLVVGAGLSPGLSGLLARQLAAGFGSVDEIHVAVHGTAGPACARDYHRSLSGRAVSWWDGEWRNTIGGAGRELCWFPEPIGALDCYHAEIASPVLLHRSFPEASRIGVRRSARRRDRFTAQLPMLRQPHPEGGVGALRVEVRGAADDGARITRVLGVAELVGSACAAMAAVFARGAAAGEFPPGVVLPGDAHLDTTSLLRRLSASGVRLQEFTGVANVG